MFPEKVGFGHGGADPPGERVSYIHRVDVPATEKFLFEGEDAEEAVDDAAHGSGASLAPSPDLRSYQVDNW